MRVTDKVLKCVGFISPDTEPLQYCGTAFVVSVSCEENSGVLHLVTAKHVAEAVGNDSFVITMNGTDGLPRFIKNGGGIRWFNHPTDDSVDVAVIPFASGIIGQYDIQDIPISMFATDDKIVEYDIGVGDEVFIVGLFTRFMGHSLISPIVRTGNIAMMPKEKISNGTEEIDAYLAEGRSIGGLSGSPAFCRSTLNIPLQSSDGSQARLSGLGPIHFLGLVHGHWYVPITSTEPKESQVTNLERNESVNLGISVIIPAKKILEVIYNPELVRIREDAFRRTAHT